MQKMSSHERTCIAVFWNLGLFRFMGSCFWTLNINFYQQNRSATLVPVAQWLEHCISSAKVVGSIPRERILKKKNTTV